MNIQEVLARHKKWLENNEGGQRAYLKGADLRVADLKGADLRVADLKGANLQRADLDFSCWPLWCGSKGIKVDLRIVYQLLAHVACLQCDDPEFVEIKKAIMSWAVKSHIAKNLGLITTTEEEV